jgi:SWI/SNF-related matrix-associated actin-dependent regulator 1 of chromatin subfamily A
MFNVLNMIDPAKWSNYYEYATKFCDGKQGYFGFEAKGATNLPELKEKISRYFLRRTKEEVLPELPSKNRIEIRIDLPKEERTQYNLVESNLIKYLKEYKKEKTDKEIEKSLSAEKLVKLNLLREINAMGKIPTAKELINSIVDAGEKVIVLSSFNGPIKELSEIYEDNSVMLLGETPVEERGELVKRFQTNPETQIFLGGTRSAGVGITLTAASNIIWLDLPWNPADLDQGENRAHRPGASYESLNIYQIISKDSIDGFMKKLLAHKQRIIDQLIEGKEVEDGEKMLNDYMKELQIKYKKLKWQKEF